MNELYANNAFTTLAAAVVTTPAAGTSEVWLVASTATQNLPQPLLPVSQFRAAVSPTSPVDANPELVLVTNVIDGTHWQVTRGAEGSPVKGHAFGDQVTCVLTKGSLTVGANGLIPANFPHTRRALGSVIAGSGPMKVLCIGDSDTFGFGAGGNPPGPGGGSWPTRLASLLNSYLAPASLGLAIPDVLNTDTRWASAAGWTINTLFGLGQASWQAAIGASDLTFTPGYNADTFDIYYVDQGTPSTFKVSIDAASGGGTTISPSGAFNIAKATVTAVAGAGHVVHIGTVAAAPVAIVGIDSYLSTAPCVRVGNAGVNGDSSSNLAYDNFYGSLPTIRSYAPDLSIIALGGLNDALTNTQATFLANITAIATACQLSGDVILAPQQPSQIPAGQTQYNYQVAANTALQALAANSNLGFYSVFNRWSPVAAYGAFYTDTYHPNALGQADIALGVLNALRQILTS